jgi:hypothetical protein
MGHGPRVKTSASHVDVLPATEATGRTEKGS